MNKKIRPALSLSRTTIRALTRADLQIAAGGKDDITQSKPLPRACQSNVELQCNVTKCCPTTTTTAATTTGTVIGSLFGC